ncbi:protein kinase domain-containing protein [Sphingosinicella sp.]|uniref:protein kinase domain-containing protein n=1 Tax=Sphingosinicella sp. TaxID=1917971 RepID=UPI004037BEE9
MSDDKNDRRPDAGDERTVFVAPGGTMPPPPADDGFVGDSEPVGAPPAPPPSAEGEGEEKTARSEPVKAKKPRKRKEEPEEKTEPSIPMPPVPTPRDEPEAATVVADGAIPMPPMPTPRDEPDAATVVAMPPVPDAGGAGEPATVIAGATTPPPTAAEPHPTTPPVPEVAAQTSPPDGTSSSTGPFVAREAQKIQVGDVLNHIFEVKRFLARGGMGEVFEGCNVNTDERVAIKVMLPQMAADEKVVAMFRKEARTLTKLQHEALVSYRVLAQEPQLGVLYIVTEFIEGVNLGDTLGSVPRGADELRNLLRRLASGLGAAHKLGAVHRDISPDNILLPGGDVHQAKIIDFGIAKDLEASSATIVGDGFAGKLNYVAPEQLGDFGREVGPWTDVYSLALVILAVANGKAVNMSGSLVDAIDKRRKGPDLTAVPGELRGVMEAMLRPDPKDRLRSMDEVIAMAGGGAGYIPPTTPPMSMPVSGPDVLPGTIVPGAPSGGGGASKGLLVGGVLAALLAVGGGAWYLMRDGGLPGFGGNSQQQQQGNQIVGPVSPPANPVEAARAAINSALPSVTCTWLDVGGVTGGANGVRVAVRGVAGDERAAQSELTQALQRAGIANGTVDFGDVAPITQAGCAALDTYRQVRATSDYHLSVPALRFEMTRQPAGAAYAGREASNAIIDFNFGNLQGDFALMGIEPNGVISYTVPDRADFDARLAQSRNGRPIADLGGDRYQLHIDADHEGWSGIILINGRGPFPQDVVAPQVGARGPTWQQRFLSAAAERNWRVEMVWYQSINRERDGRPAARPQFGQPQR